MIWQITGKLIAKNGLLIIVDVQGVGYGLYAPAGTLLKLPEVGNQVSLYTHLVVREDAQVLYGFYTESERFLFTELIKISGVGPKLSLSILSHLSIEQLLQSIQLQELSQLTSIPGVGKKMAQRLMVEMQNNINSKKFIEFFELRREANVLSETDNLSGHIINDAQEALVSLGDNQKEAVLAVRSVMQGLQDSAKQTTLSSEMILKSCLKFLSKAYHD